MAESELFSFNTGGKKPSLRPGDKAASSSLVSKSHTINSDSEGGSSSVGSGYSSDEDRKQTKRNNRSHRHGVRKPPLGKEGSIVSRLKPITMELEDSDEEDLVRPIKIPCTNSGVRSESGSRRERSTSSFSPSPVPSPTPHSAYGSTPDDRKSSATLNKVNHVLHLLRSSKSSASSLSDNSYSDGCSLVDVSPMKSEDTLTLRVRCKGRVHKFCIHKRDPLSGVCAKLAARVGAENADHLLLSHKNSTINQTESPQTLGLTTADIIDAVVMSQSMVNGNASRYLYVDSHGSGGQSITIKVQSSNKSILYSLSKSDPLQKAMAAFASALGVSVSKLKFMFDGDPILPTQTAIDLDMEDDDCIDVAMIA